MSFVGSSLARFFVFDPRLGPTEETEHEKILYYWPPSTPLNRQQSDIGLSEALINFTRTFSKDRPCEAVHLEKTRQAFYECEPDIWMVLAANNPATARVKDSVTTNEYESEELSDATLQRVVEQAYKTFRLFNGSMAQIVRESKEDGLREKLSDFFGHYAPTINFKTVDLFSALDGVHFLPVDKNVYLRIQSFVNWTENNFPSIEYSCFLYRDHLVWSGLEQEDMRIMYHYLVNHLLPPFKKWKDPKQQVWPIVSPTSKPNAVPYFFLKCLFDGKWDGYMQAPQGVQPTVASLPMHCPRIQLSRPHQYHTASNGQQQAQTAPDGDFYNLIIFQMLDTTCLFLVRDATKLDARFFTELRTFVTPQLEFLTPILTDHWTKKQGYADDYRYIYFNHMNLALKTSIKKKGLSITREHMKILTDMHADFEKATECVTELMVRTQNDGWVVGRKSDQREFYVIFDQKNANLLEINDEVRKLCSTYFNNIFID